MKENLKTKDQYKFHLKLWRGKVKKTMFSLIICKTIPLLIFSFLLLFFPIYINHNLFRKWDEFYDETMFFLASVKNNNILFWLFKPYLFYGARSVVRGPLYWLLLWGWYAGISSILDYPIITIFIRQKGALNLHVMHVIFI